MDSNTSFKNMKNTILYLFQKNFKINGKPFVFDQKFNFELWLKLSNSGCDIMPGSRFVKNKAAKQQKYFEDNIKNDPDFNKKLNLIIGGKELSFPEFEVLKKLKPTATEE